MLKRLLFILLFSLTLSLSAQNIAKYDTIYDFTDYGIVIGSIYGVCYCDRRLGIYCSIW